MRAGAWALVGAGVAAPLLRRRLALRPAAVTATAALAPIALCVATPRSRKRDAAACALQMWAYVATYQMPHDDPEALERRVRVDYPVTIDRALGLGIAPTLRLQRRFATPGGVSAPDKVLIWCHWLWFLTPHSALLYTLFRDRERFPRAAVLTYAVFDIGTIGYWAVPTAPPWYAAAQGRLHDPRTPPLRRLMYEHGELFWRRGWRPLYDFLGGNPLAAMPSLHFATSVMAAHLLAEMGPSEGAVGWSYAIALGFALVYLGEHYLVDLIAGLALTQAVRRAEPATAPFVRAVARGVRALEARAQAA
jgi:hypothetical protein